MQANIEKVLQRIENTDDGKGRVTSFSSVPRSTGKLLEFFVLAFNAKSILELGCSAGYSTLWMAKALKQTGGHIYTIEADPLKIELAKQNFKDAQVEQNVTLLEEDIFEVLKNWEYGEVDFVFLDSGKNDYQQQYELLVPLLRGGGIILADNITSHPGALSSFVDSIEKDPRVNTLKLECDNGLLFISKKFSN